MVLSKLTMSLTHSVSNRRPLTRRRILAISRVRERIPRILDRRLIWIVAYMKKVKEALKEKRSSEDEITAFEKGAQAYAKKIVAKFKDYDFYIGESMDPDGM